MDVHSGNNEGKLPSVDVHNGDKVKAKGKPAQPRDGFLRLSKELAESYGMSYRQLWRKARAGEIPRAVQSEGGSWYIPVGAEVGRARSVITSALQEQVIEALRSQDKPAAIARRLGLAESTVYKIREQHQEKLASGQARPREQDRIRNGAEVAALHRGAGPMENTAIVAIDLAAADQEVLKRLVPFEGYFDPSRNTFYVSPELVQEIVRWEDAREERLEKLYQSTTHYLDPEEHRRRWAARAQQGKMPPEA